MSEKPVREIFYYKDYYLNFFETLQPEVKKKFNWILQLITILDRIPKKFFKHITDSSDLYEIRIEFGSNIYRVFCFFDKDQLIILLNCYQKKTEKIPLKELQLAEKLKKQYFDEKNK